MEKLDYSSSESIFIYVLNTHGPVNKSVQAKYHQFKTNALRKVIKQRSRLKVAY